MFFLSLGEMVGAFRWQNLLEECARQYMPVCGEASTVSLSGVLERLKLVRLVNIAATSTTVANLQLSNANLGCDLTDVPEPSRDGSGRFSSRGRFADVLGIS